MSSLSNGVEHLRSVAEGEGGNETAPEALASQASEGIDGRVKRAKTQFKRAKEKVADAQVIVVERSRKTARAADDYVHARPWTVAGVALGVGVLVGLLIGRR